MAYIGQKGGTVSTLTSKTLDTMTGDGSDATLTLSQTPASVNDVAVYLDGVFQRPTNEYTLSGNVITFTTAPANGVFICAVTGGGHDIGSPLDGSVSTDKLIDGTITSAMVATMSSSKLTGALGALDGSALTGIPSTIIKNASDPAIDTNPSGGLGTVWANTTSGEMYILTDATTDSNVWYNVGGGDGDVAPYTFGGTISGYTSGGANPSNSNIIEKFSFTSDGDATDVGDLTVSRGYGGGQSSTTHGYQSGGHSPPTNVIDKFSFATDGDATDVGDLTVARTGCAGQTSETHGYTSGGGSAKTIDKFTFAADADATDVGDMSVVVTYITGQSSSTHGYISGGHGTPVSTNQIEKFSFSSDGNTSNSGVLTAARDAAAGQSSSTHGYTSGGENSVTVTIDKFTFASDSDATDVADLTVARAYTAGQSSTTHGYTSGGYPPISLNVIDKFSFAAGSNATDVGDMTGTRMNLTGNQV